MAAESSSIEGAWRAVSLAPLALVLALCAGVGAAGAAGLAPASVAAPASAVTLFLGLGLPLVVWRSPVEPSWMKLATFASLLSPVVGTALWIAFRGVLDAPGATTATLGAGVPLALLLARGRAYLGNPGRAAWGALALAAGCAALVAWVALRGNAVRVSYHGLEHASLLFAVERSLPPENPWLAGTELSYYWAWHALGALVARALHVAPTYAFAGLNLWSAATSALALYFLAAPLFRRGSQELLGVALALFGLNAYGGWAWLLDGAPFTAPAAALDLVRATLAPLAPGIADGTGVVDPRLAFGFSKAFNVSSHPVSLALLCGGWAAAAHALRHGERPWPGLAGVLHGAAFAMNPVIGGAGIAATGVAALLFSGSRAAAVRTSVQLALWAAPGALLVLQAGGSGGGSLVAFGFDASRAAGGGLVLGALAPPALFALRRAEGERERGAILGLLLCGVLVPFALFPIVSLPVGNEYKLVRVAAVPLGLLAGGGLVAAASLPRVGPWLGGALALLLGGGVLANNALGLRGYAALAEVDLPLIEAPGRLLPDHAPSDDRRLAEVNDLAATWRLIGDVLAPLEPDAILMANTLWIPPEYVASDGRRGRFTEDFNVQGHEAAAFCRLSLWCDRKSYQVERHPDWAARLAQLSELYRKKNSWHDGNLAALRGLERPVLALVAEVDRREHERNGDLDQKFRSLGFADVAERGSVALFAWPPEYAERARAAAAADASRR